MEISSYYVVMASSSASTPSTTSMPSSTSKRMRKNAAGAGARTGWEHGIDMGDRKVKCKFCDNVYTSGINRFKHHLARTGQNVGPCTKVPEDVTIKFLKLLEDNETSTKKKRGILSIGESQEVHNMTDKGRGMDKVSMKGKGQSTINAMFKKDDRERVCQQIASVISFNCVNNPEFKKMVKMIGDFGRGLDPPSYHEMRVTCLKKEFDYTKALLEEYKQEWKKTGCTLMSDEWTDRKHQCICNFLVNSPKGTIFLASIDASDIVKTKEKVFSMLDDFIEKIGEEYVVQVVTDNATNYKAAGEMLMEKRKKLFWTPCAAHCIDLMLEDFEKKIGEHKETIAKARKITSFIYNRSRLICIMKEFTKGKELLRPGATRFATSYLTLSRLYDQKNALISMFASEKWANCSYARSKDGMNVENIILDKLFWGSVLSCLKAAIPMVRVLRTVDSDRVPAMGDIYIQIMLAKAEIKSNFKDVQARYQPILDIIEQRWENQLRKPLHLAGYFLNPRTQYSPSYDCHSGFIKDGLYTCLQRMCGNDSTLAKTIDCQFDEFRNARGLFGLEVAKLIRDAKSPVDWWDSYGDETPEFDMLIIWMYILREGIGYINKKMNDLVYVMYNLKLSKREENHERRLEAECLDLQTLNFDDVCLDDEWITEEDTTHHDANEEWINVFGESSSHGGVKGLCARQ
ncbi:hypothetical protein OSB04_006238 [Centaurea solstitialis]|uniref:DUF659 domain-containing protein n=1 Tax=Centaurea solstitialis TaxID=347529 RepID=A0AA38TQ44_9ASTR|nr:hypothetical protein OSB04_006238 [Centaurea solstitialis]